MLKLEKMTSKNNVWVLHYYNKEGKIIKKFIPIKKDV